MDIRNIYFRYIWFGLLMLVAVYVRVHGSAIYHFHVDELMHMKIAEGATLGQVLHYSLYETHPPLGHLIRHFWVQVSEATWWNRALSLPFGLGTILLYYFIGRRMHGELTGLCAAALIAFGHGCVIQSYVVRNYSMFALFLSAAFYFQLLWHDERKNKWLVWYFFSACCACLTHFSGIFTVFILTLYEAVRSDGHDKDIRNYIKWGTVNVIVALISVATFLIWRETLTPIEEYAAHAASSYKAYELLLLVPLYLVHVNNYIFPRPEFIYVLAIIIPLAIARKDKELNPWLALAAFSLFFGIVLFLTKVYPFVGDRHALWLLPLFIPPAAWILADGFLWATKKPAWAAVAIFIFCAVLYDSGARFDDSLEYRITEAEWHEIPHYLDRIDNRTLLISGRTDAIMLAPENVNIYSFISGHKATESDITKPVPYYHTHLLFDRAYRMFSSNMVTMLRNALTTGELKDYDRVAFATTFISMGFTGQLIVCPELTKEIVSFPAAEPGHIFTKDELRKYTAIFVIVKKQDLIEQVLTPGAKASSCVKNDLYNPFSK